MLLLARVTPTLVTDAAADRAFATEATTPALPGRGLDLKASVSGLTDPQSLDDLAKLFDSLPGWGPPQISVSPLVPYTDPREPTPVIRTSADGPDLQAIVFARGDANTSLVSAPGTTPDSSNAAGGMWIPDTAAQLLGVSPGDSVDVALKIRNPTPQEIAKAGGESVRVAGVYQTSHGLPVSDTVDWPAIAGSLPRDPTDTSRPATLLIVDQPTAVSLISGMGDVPFEVWDAQWRAPTTLQQGRVSAAAWRALHDQLQDAGSGAGSITAAARVQPVTLATGVEIFVARAEDAAAALHPLVSSIGFAAQIISVAVLGTMLWLLVRSRRTEHLVSLRAGVHPLRIGVAGMVEQIGAVIVAAGAVYAIVRWTPNVLAGSGSIDTRTLSEARSVVLWTIPWIIAFIVAAVTAAVWPLEPTSTVASGRLADAFRWETVVVIAAIATGAQLMTQTGPALDSGSALLFPLLALLAGAMIIVRIVAAVVRRMSRRTHAQRVEPPRFLAMWLARRRLIFVLAEVSALVVVVAAGTGMFVYSASVARDGERGVADKAAALGGAPATTAIGAASQLFIGADGFPAGLPDGWNVVWRASDVHMAQDVVADVLVVDPDRFAQSAAWRDSFADKPLPELMADLANPKQGTVNVIVAGNYDDTFPTDGTLIMQGLFTPYHVVDRIAAAPGQRERSSMVIMDERTLAPLIPDATGAKPGPMTVDGLDRVFLSEVWSSGSQAQLDAALAQTTQHADQTDTTNVAIQSRRADFVAFGLSLPYLRLAGGAMLLVALASLWVHGNRRRANLAIDIAMTRAMGVRRAATTAALVFEAVLVGIASVIVAVAIAAPLVGFMTHRLDPAPSFAPRNSGGLSWPAVAAAAALVVVVSIASALMELHAVRRLPVAEVLRGGD